MTRAVERASSPTGDPEVLELLQLDGGGRSRRRWRWLLAAAIGLALVAGIVVATRPAAPEPPVAVPVKVGRFEEVVTAVGPVEPRHAVSVASEISGVVDEVLVDVNDRVEAGQVLARLDTTTLDAQVAQAQAQVAAARAAVDEAEAASALSADGLRRANKLGNAIAEESRTRAALEDERAKAAVEAARAQLASARASQAVAQAQRDRAILTAPVSGVVLERHVEPGQAVVSALQAATLFRIAEDLDRLSLELEVDEADVGRVQAGQAVRFTVAAWPEREFEGTVRRVTLAPRAASQIVTYEALVDVDNDDGALRPGMTATADLVVAVHERALQVPSGALRWQPDGVSAPATERVWVGPKDKPEPVEVTRIASRMGWTAVTASTPLEGRSVWVAASEAP